ncbi:ImmA/IrrE family metallo-endopeptidase [Clostridium sp. CS001]|uniref:ImmA/IrrE family metallo-endopeptidase n=1 Tax=Clostridium sp. CS001 TaxID=2880648 RepID=UPI001CF2987A|nr:ImmA/IrrE family metallo-endopeptidase [Clostridium sp. CS001]MCB2291568.1 ImmA/IrrE family metallo-endopeptidase [Clostridium sp. CS001]
MIYEESIFPFRSKDRLEEIAENHLEVYNSSLIKVPSEITITDFIERHLRLELKFLPISEDREILGYMVFKPSKIITYNSSDGRKQYLNIAEPSVIVDSELSDNSKAIGRFRFTCAHEAAHWILHRDYFLQDGEHSLVSDSEDIFKDNSNEDYRDNIENDERMEWQANYLGGALLMPKRTFTKEFLKTLLLLGINNQPYLYRDSQLCNINNYRYMISKITSVFNVSKEAARIRLLQLNLLKEEEYNQNNSRHRIIN